MILCGSVYVQARTLSESEALQVAQAFISGHHIDMGSNLMVAKQRGSHRAPGVAAAYYVFNASQTGDGYVIVSGDDRAIPVLAYSDSGHFDADAIPPAMQLWLDAYAQEIESLEPDDDSFDATAQAPAGRITPLLTCNWDQNEPYNSLLPNTANGERAATGCVATAMAQVMYYYKWPVAPTKAIPQYLTKSQSISMPEPPVVNFDWANMKDNYLPTSTGVSADAVATLMLYCDQALNMDFKDGTSSASTSNIPDALQQYFDYAPSCRYYARNNFSRDTWEQLIYSELRAHRPVVYRGEKMNKAGHSFVCDGYDNGLFHFNWGWGSSSNGYFALSALRPNSQGTGSAQGNEGYILGQAIVAGIQPAKGSIANTTAMTFSALELPATSYTRANSSANFTGISIKGRFSNHTGATQNFVAGWGLYQGDTRLAIISNETSSTFKFNELPNGYGRTGAYPCSLGAGLADGTYRIVPISRLASGDSWEICESGDVNYVIAQVAGNRLTLAAHGISSDIKPNYTLNDITINGNRRVGKTLEIVANVTNRGNSVNNVAYLFVDGVKNTVAITQSQSGETEDLKFYYTPSTTGNKTLSVTFNEDGTSPIATQSVTIEEMPEANLTMTLTVPNSTNAVSGRSVAGNTLIVEDLITNNLASDYDEDIVAKICRVTKVNGTSYSGSAVMAKTQALRLAGNGTDKLTFSFDELITGESYFVIFYYYNQGELVRARSTARYKMTGGSTGKKGDANGDGKVDVEDVNLVINFILKVQTPTASQITSCDMDNNGKIDVEDVNAIINIILGV